MTQVPVDTSAFKLTRMRQIIVTVAGAVHSVSFALWLGGIIAIGALIGPAVANVLATPPPQLPLEPLKMTLTTGIIGQALRNFNIICYVGGVLMIGADIVETALVNGASFKALTFARLALTVALLLSAYYLGENLTPRMDALLANRATGMVLFDQLHKQYENVVTMGQFPMLLAISILTAARNSGKLIYKPSTN